MVGEFISIFYRLSRQLEREAFYWPVPRRTATGLVLRYNNQQSECTPKLHFPPHAVNSLAQGNLRSLAAKGLRWKHVIFCGSREDVRR